MSRLVKRQVLCLQLFNRTHNAKLRKTILDYADAELISPLCECAYNILRGTVRLTPLENVRLRRYTSDLRTIANRKSAVTRRRRILQQKGGFLPALLAALAITVFIHLLRQLVAYMAHVRNMALVDPRLLETWRTPRQSPSDLTLCDIDAEMTSILDRPDIDVSEKVRLHNQKLLSYNEMTKTRVNKPTRVVVVN